MDKAKLAAEALKALETAGTTRSESLTQNKDVTDAIDALTRLAA